MTALNVRTGDGTKGMQYSVYIYHRPSNENNKHANWELTSVTNDLRAAKQQAKSLYKTNKYEKVELQKNAASFRSRPSGAKIVKIYDERTGLKGFYKDFIAFLPEFAISAAILTAFYFLL